MGAFPLYREGGAMPLHIIPLLLFLLNPTSSLRTPLPMFLTHPPVFIYQVWPSLRLRLLNGGLQAHRSEKRALHQEDKRLVREGFGGLKHYFIFYMSKSFRHL